MTTKLRSSGARYFSRRAFPTLENLPAPEIDRFEPEAVRFSARAWTMKAEQEHRSAAVFAEAVSLLVDTGAPLDVVSALSRVVSDEVSHAELCTRMARVFGAENPVLTPLPRTPLAPEARRARALQLLLVEGAIGETISCALFNAGRHVTREPLSRAALARILRDEVGHARVCWEALGVLGREPDGATLASFQEIARNALGTIEQSQMAPVLARLKRGDPFDPAWGELGVLPPEKRVEAFYGAIEKRVVPGLTSLGLDGEAAWRDRYRA